jgi:hypothetical protein
LSLPMSLYVIFEGIWQVLFPYCSQVLR